MPVKKPHKNNSMHQMTWRHKNQENMDKYREICRKAMTKIYLWKKIKMEFLRILLD